MTLAPWEALSNIAHIRMDYLWALNSVPLVYVSIFMLAPYCFDYYSFVAYFETKAYVPPALFFLLRIALA